MTDARAAVGMDRLPWLSDEPTQPPRRVQKPREPKATRARVATSAIELAGWLVAAVLVVGGGSYWLGTRSVEQAVESSTAIEPKATLTLPDARETVQPQVPIAQMPQVRPTTTPTIAVPRATKPARRLRHVERKRKLSPMDMSTSDLGNTVAAQEGIKPEEKKSAEEPAAAKPPTVTSAPTAKQQPASKPQSLGLWPARETKDAYGRMVRIGAFGSRQQAKLGWRKMQRVYPAVGRLPATVVTDRNSRGRTFYRFQIGTTSQAHSEVLCQRMQSIRFSCAVVGLPWKAKIER